MLRSVILHLKYCYRHFEDISSSPGLSDLSSAVRLLENNYLITILVIQFLISFFLIKNFLHIALQQILLDKLSTSYNMDEHIVLYDVMS